MRSITVADLPANPPAGVSLYCPNCGEHYSATRGDYFMTPLGQVFRCHNDKTRLQLVKRQPAVLTAWSRE